MDQVTKNIHGDHGIGPEGRIGKALKVVVIN